MDAERAPAAAEGDARELLGGGANGAANGGAAQLERVALPSATNGRFVLPTPRQYSRQYAQVYFSRLMAQRAPLEAAANAAGWQSHAKKKRVVDLASAIGEECYITGTLFKNMKLQPRILDEYLKDGGLSTGAAKPDSYVGDDDTIVLEEETGRVALVGSAVETERLVTGVVATARGKVNAKGEFVVEEMLFPGVPKQKPRPMEEGEASYIALVSGLGVGSPSSNPLAASLLVDFLTGQLGSAEEQKLCSRIARVIVAGNSLCVPEASAQGSGRGGGGMAAREAAKLGAPLAELDLLLAELASAVPIDLMPGESDPANVALPQQPMHSALFPRASTYSTYRPVTNPYTADVGGVSIVGTSGQALDDLSKFTKGVSRLELLEATLRWRHLAPTAPDSLASYPYSDEDPFVVQDSPHVYFAGNQRQFDTKLVEGVRLVCVPDFATTGQIVLVNTHTLECRLMEWSVDGAAAPENNAAA